MGLDSFEAACEWLDPFRDKEHVPMFELSGHDISQSLMWSQKQR